MKKMSFPSQQTLSVEPWERVGLHQFFPPTFWACQLVHQCVVLVKVISSVLTLCQVGYCLEKKQFFSVPPKLQFLSIHEFILTITFGQVYSTRLGMASDPLTVVPPLQPEIGTSPMQSTAHLSQVTTISIPQQSQAADLTRPAWATE